MISATLLTALKVAIPVGTVASMGGAIYFASEYLPRKSTSSDVVYLLVKGKTQATATSKTLTTEVNSKTTKYYLCQSTLGNKTIKDKDCSLFKLNSDATAPTSIDINENMFSDSLLAGAAGSVTATSHHILKVSKSFYSSFEKATTENKEIQLTNTEEKTNHLGTVTVVAQLDLDNKKPLAEQLTNLFLARITSKGTGSLNASTDAIFCKLSDTQTVACKIYKAATSGNEKTNSHTNTTISNLSALGTTALTDTDVGTYFVVELTDTKVKVSELQNKTLTIHKTIATNATLADSEKIAEVTFDQLLVGKVNATQPNTSNIFPLMPKFKTFGVKKGTPTDGFTNPQTSSSKNYKCKFTVNTKDNFDNSCELKEFPTLSSGKKVNTYSGIQSPSTALTGVQSDITSKDNFVLSVDTNKLFNLNPDWTKSDLTDIVVVLEDSATPAKTAPFTLLHELTENKATGRTNLALVKYKSKAAVSGTGTLSPATKHCFFTDADTTGFACSLKKVTKPTSVPTEYDSLEFDGTEATTFTESDHYALLITTETRNIKDFDSSTINCHLAESGTNNKYTFDIIAAMGGDVTANKTLYFLETPRTIMS